MKIGVNASDFIRVVEKTKGSVDAGVRLGVGQVLLEIGARADELVPFDTGALSRSQTTSITAGGGVVIGEIGYGGPAAPYALVQHEDTTLSHPPKAKGGSPTKPGTARSPKYLEYPTNQVGKRANNIIANAVRRSRGS